MTPTEARALADKFSNLWTPLGWSTEARAALRSLADQVEALEKYEESLRQLVDKQAIDAGLWFKAATATEAYLQQELRHLHAAIEREAT